jgi:hypothetical protein
MATLNDGGLTCRYGIKLSLQKEEINNAVNILYHTFKRAGDSMQYDRGEYRKRSIALTRNM